MGNNEKMMNERRLVREKQTLTAMIELYCHDLHKPESGLCLDCTDLLTYAEKRLIHCLFHDAKPTCAKCPVHCYQPFMRGQIQWVMRYAGPRMLKRHPVLTFWHFVDGWRSKRMIRKLRKRAGTTNITTPDVVSPENPFENI